MSLTVRGRVGQPSRIGNNVETELRSSHLGAAVITNLHGKYAEQAMRKNLFYGANASSGVAPGTSITTSPPLALYNPTDSDVLLVLLKTWMAFKSGTLGVGTLYLTGTPQAGAAPSGGTQITARNAYLGKPVGAGQLWAGTTLTVTPTILKPVSGVFPIVDTTAAQPNVIEDDLDGSVIVPPGFAVGLQEVGAAGSSPLVQFGVLWEEVPIPL